jgi:DNA mismatch repair protein MutS
MSKRGMMDQFTDIKTEHPDSVLFFRMGDFYELFHEDAVTGSEVLGLALTSRDKKADKPIKMAGFPWHALEDNIRTMLKAGHKVTVAEQEQELREGAKLLERVVTRVYTPGSLYEESLLGTEERSLLLSICLGKSSIGIGIIDASTGQAWASNLDGDDRFSRALDEVLRWRPTEIVVAPKDADDATLRALFTHLDGVTISQHKASEAKRRDRLTKVLKVADLGHIDLDDAPLAIAAAGLAADYLASMHLTEEVPLRDLEVMEENAHLVLDQTTLRNLELTSTLAGEYEGSLLSTMNACRSAMGRRLLKTWILRPLADLNAIAARHDAVATLSRSARRLDGLREALRGLRDMERLATQLAYNRSNGRDLLAVADALERMPAIINLCKETENPLLLHLSSNLDALQDVAENIRRTLVQEPPLSVRDGGLLRPGFDSKVDELREIATNGHTWFTDLETKLKAELQIPSLKVKMNRQIGWFIEVTKINEAKAPEHWKRKQQMTNGSRYVTDELLERDDALLTADTKLKELEYREFINLREACKGHAQTLAQIAGKVAAIDVLQCFGTIARSRAWTRPEMAVSDQMKAQGARHPVLEQQSGFVPNDLDLTKKRKFLLITGPNMGGKSTYLRTTALMSILAQSGSFVPAEKAKIGLVDRIFTRVGASDDLRRGRSTFMMEMIEVAHILRRATSNSLVLLDEIGRGTSTFDGLSIAWSVTEDICKRIQARTLFATHYHQLIGLEGEVDGLVNVHVQVAEANGELRFMHTVADGPCDDSYGVQVAALAGLPRPVVERATDLLAFLERQAEGAKAGESGTPTARANGQSSLMGYFAAAAMNQTTTKDSAPKTPQAHQDVIQNIEALDVDEMTPRQAHDALYQLKKLLGGDAIE